MIGSISSSSVSTSNAITSASVKSVEASPLVSVPPLDPIDLSVFSVTSTDTDAGKTKDDPKSRMSMKDYIAYMLLLIQKLNSLKEDGPQPLNARLENKDEMAAVLKAIDS